MLLCFLLSYLQLDQLCSCVEPMPSAQLCSDSQYMAYRHCCFHSLCVCLLIRRDEGLVIILYFSMCLTLSVCVWGGGGSNWWSVRAILWILDVSFASKVVSSALACASDVCTSVRSFCIAGKQGVTSTCFFFCTLNLIFFFFTSTAWISLKFFFFFFQLEVVLQFHGEPFSPFVGFQPGTSGSSASACLRAAAVKTCGEAVTTIQKVSISKCN